MKKVMMMVAVGLVAGMTQAAAVAWNTGAIKAPTAPTGAFGSNVGSTTGTYNALAYFFVDSGGSPGAAVTGLTGTSDNSTSVASVLNGTTSDSFAANTTYWVQVYVWTTDGLWEMTSTIASFTTPGTGGASINFLSGAGFDSATNKMPSQWTAVPEPTSMALLALGVAAVGLRRKFRK